MKAITGSELCKLLEARGWKLQRISGSHHIYSNPGERKILSVPVHNSRNLKPGLAARLARDAKIEW